MPPELLLDPAKIDLTNVVADLEAIRKHNSQRFEMEQLTAITFVDATQHLVIGYKDVGQDEFWVRGHMPGYPIMPGVIMCECAAQLSAYYIASQKLLECDYVGLGGLENVRFRGLVRPGDRLVMVAKGTRINRRQVICNVQGFVGIAMVFHADVIGLPLHRKPEGP